MSPEKMNSLQLLLDQAQQQSDMAQSALRQAEEQARRSRAQHDQLLGYRAEYEARWSSQFRQGSTVDILMHYRSFMQRLDQAVAMQLRQAQQAEAHCAQARERLLDCERRVASVRKLMERRRAELAQAGERREQKQNDEQAQRRRWALTRPGQLMPN